MIIGAGSWGTALALVAARAGNRVRLWGHSSEVVTLLKQDRENKIYLPGFALPDSIEPTGDLTGALAGAEIVLTVTPSHVCREIYTKILDHARPRMIFINASKGIEVETGMRMEEVVNDVLKDRFGPRYVSLSGPSFALEVARDEPCAIVAASHSSEWAKIARIRFRPAAFEFIRTMMLSELRSVAHKKCYGDRHRRGQRPGAGLQ